MKIEKVFSLFKAIIKLEKICVIVDDNVEGKNIFKHFNSRHPKLIVVKNKSLGVGLIKVQDFASDVSYLSSVNGKNSAAYFSRKASKFDYQFRQINPLEHLQEVFEINNSSSTRQGREMDDSYKTTMDYPINEENVYFGIVKNGELVAYLWLIKTGELLLLNRILGHAKHIENGIMYLLVTSAVQHSFKHFTYIKYIMYDTIFGASDGLKLFKKRCGFKPYKVVWKLNKI